MYPAVPWINISGCEEARSARLFPRYTEKGRKAENKRKQSVASENEGIELLNKSLPGNLGRSQKNIFESKKNQ